MAKLNMILAATLCYFVVVCEGKVHQITYNEDDLVGSCTDTCGELPDRSNQFGCDRISNCRFNRKGWTRGFVRCDWCTCDCTTSGDLPQKEVIAESKVIMDEDFLWGTCTRTCSAPGLQKTNVDTDRFKCSEVRDCRHHRNGWTRGFVRCDYCECNCVLKGYPDKYRLENVEFKIGVAVIGEADSVVVGQTTVENHSRREQTFSRSISTSIETSVMWEQTKGTSLTVGTAVSISVSPLEILSVGVEVSTSVTETYEYTWGETKTTTVTDSTEQTVVVGPLCSTEARMVGTTSKASVPYTADLVTVYDNGRETRKSISGVLHEATVSNVHLVYGECTPLQG